MFVAFFALPSDPAGAVASGMTAQGVLLERLGITARAQALAATIASRAPIAAETARVNLRAALSMPLEKAVEYERDLQAICFATADAKEGRKAFEEKRAPKFERR